MASRSELLKLCSESNLKNYKNLKKEELKNLLEIVEKNRENLLEKYDGKVRIKRPLGVIIFNDGNNTVYSSMSKAAKSLGTYPMQIYVLIARGKGMFLVSK